MNQLVEDPLAAVMAPVFERLGGAVYCCQSFEHSISYLIALAVEATEGDPTGQLQTASLEHSSSLTLGRLLDTLKKTVPMQDVETDALRLALKLRNKIVHHWLSDNIERLKTPEGRKDSIDRLNAATSALRIAESIANEYIDAFLKRYGLSTEALKEQADSTFRLLDFESFDDLPPQLH